MKNTNRIFFIALCALLLGMGIYGGSNETQASSSHLVRQEIFSPPMMTAIHLFPSAGAASQSLSKSAVYPVAVGGGTKSHLDFSEWDSVEFRVHAKAHTLTANGHHVGLEWQDSATGNWYPLDANDGGKTLMAGAAIAFVDDAWSGFDPDVITQGGAFVRVVHGDGDLFGSNPTLLEVSMQLRQAP